MQLLSSVSDKCWHADEEVAANEPEHHDTKSLYTYSNLCVRECIRLNQKEDAEDLEKTLR